MSHKHSIAPKVVSLDTTSEFDIDAEETGIRRIVRAVDSRGETGLAVAEVLTPKGPAKVPSVRHAVDREDLEPYMYLVHQAVARVLRKLPPSVQRDDLFAAGSFGLLDALRRHGGERGPEFEWYARVRIRGAIFDELRNQDWLSRTARAEATAACEPDSDGRIACVGVIGFEDLPEGKRFMAPADEESPLDLAERNSQRAALAKAVNQLPEREAQIVHHHYFQGLQFKEIATMMKVSEPRISQLHSRAMALLRKIVDGDAYDLA